MWRYKEAAASMANASTTDEVKTSASSFGSPSIRSVTRRGQGGDGRSIAWTSQCQPGERPVKRADVARVSPTAISGNARSPLYAKGPKNAECAGHFACGGWWKSPGARRVQAHEGFSSGRCKVSPPRPPARRSGGSPTFILPQGVARARSSAVQSGKGAPGAGAGSDHQRVERATLQNHPGERRTAHGAL